jgi:hypothetical protein
MLRGLKERASADTIRKFAKVRPAGLPIDSIGSIELTTNPAHTLVVSLALHTRNS